MCVCVCVDTVMSGYIPEPSDNYSFYRISPISQVTQVTTEPLYSYTLMILYYTCTYIAVIVRIDTIE